MLDRKFLRVGGGAAMVSAVLALIFNLLHPRGDVDPVTEELELVLGSDIWLFDHYMLAWALAFGVVGLIAIGWSYTDAPAQGWARAATAAAIVSLGIALITLAVDGMAQKAVADEWAAAQDDTTYATAAAVSEISAALFTATIGSLRGLTPVLFAITGFNSAQYPKWLAWLALISGLTGFVASTIQFYGGISPTSVWIYTVASLGYTVWLFMMGWKLWSGGPSPDRTEAGRDALAA